MKKFKIVILMIGFMFLLVSCATSPIQVPIQIGQDSQEILAKIGARRIGSYLQVKYPEIAKECLPMAKAFVDKKESSGLFKDFLKSATEKIDDPLLKADIKDILSMIEIKGPEIPENYAVVLESAMNGFYQGLTMEVTK